MCCGATILPSYYDQMVGSDASLDYVICPLSPLLTSSQSHFLILLHNKSKPPLNHPSPLSLDSPVNGLQHSNTPLLHLKHKRPSRARLNHLLRLLNDIRATHLIHRIRPTRACQYCELSTITSLCAGKAEGDRHASGSGGVVDGGFPDVGLGGTRAHGAGDVEERVEGAVEGTVGNGIGGGGGGKGGREFVVGEELKFRLVDVSGVVQGKRQRTRMTWWLVEREVSAGSALKEMSVGDH